jgi:hypothetical protein
MKLTRNGDGRRLFASSDADALAASKQIESPAALSHQGALLDRRLIDASTVG